ncbi:MAG: hypothetical protein ACOCV1_02410 [Bacillota bacterium]
MKIKDLIVPIVETYKVSKEEYDYFVDNLRAIRLETKINFSILEKDNNNIKIIAPKIIHDRIKTLWKKT